MTDALLTSSTSPYDGFVVCQLSWDKLYFSEFLFHYGIGKGGLQEKSSPES
jgi:hypothetical protein